MSIKVLGNELSITKFPAGESLVRFSQREFLDSRKFIIRMDFESNDDLINLAMTVDAIRRSTSFKVDLHLLMPYLPYARQDRVCNTGESLSVKVIADFINDLAFNTVVCYDLHSDVSGALINNLHQTTLDDCMRQLGMFEIIANDHMILVAPDAGAYKKVFKLNQYCNNGYMVTASKVRDTTTGEITDTKTDIELDKCIKLSGRKFLIVDDICDGGYTFVKLAESIKFDVHDAKVFLYVTHGIFTKGYGVFDELIDGIYTANLMGENNPLILIGNK